MGMQGRLPTILGDLVEQDGCRPQHGDIQAFLGLERLWVDHLRSKSGSRLGASVGD